MPIIKKTKKAKIIAREYPSKKKHRQPNKTRIICMVHLMNQSGLVSYLLKKINVVERTMYELSPTTRES